MFVGNFINWEALVSFFAPKTLIENYNFGVQYMTLTDINLIIPRISNVFKQVFQSKLNLDDEACEPICSFIIIPRLSFVNTFYVCLQPVNHDFPFPLRNVKYTDLQYLLCYVRKV
jgi:hypothetical protein